MIDIRVDLDSLRRALRSVLPHVGKEFPSLNRVRGYLTDAMELVVVATDRFTLGMASVEVLDTTGELGAFDLSPQDVADLLAQFPVARNDDGESEIRIRWDQKTFTFTDVTGLFDAEKELTLPSVPVDDTFPDLGQLLRHLRDTYTSAADVERGSLNPASPYMSVNGQLLSRFAAVAKVQGCPLVIEPVGRARTLLITCGPDFIGALMPVRQDEDKITEFTGHRETWTERYPTIRLVHPTPPKVPNADTAAAPTAAWVVEFDAVVRNDPPADQPIAADVAESGDE